MDDILSYCDELFLDKVYSAVFPAATSTTPSILKTIAQWGDHHASTTASTSLFPRDSVLRQYVSLSAMALLSAFFLYFAISTVSYYLIFDRRLEHHPRFLHHQVRKEISLSVKAMPVMALVIAPWFVAEVRGHSLLFDGWLPEGSQGSYLGLGPVAYNIASVAIFMLFTDYCIYWIHRWLHIPFLYKMLHKPHHRWLVPTPFAAMAFHPLDGYAQSLPYHFIVHLLPLNKWLYLGLFGAVNVWTVLIHDGDMITGHFLESYINSPAHHTLHHLYFTCNYGQYFTWADYYNGSYRPPRPELDPIHESLRNMERKEKVAAELAVADDKRRKRERAEGGQGLSTVDEESDSGYEGSEVEGANGGGGDASSSAVEAKTQVKRRH